MGYGERIFKNLSAYGITTSGFSSCISSSFNLTSTGPYFFCFHMSAARASRVNDHICGIFEDLRKVSVSYIPPFLSYDYFFLVQTEVPCPLITLK